MLQPTPSANLSSLPASPPPLCLVLQHQLRTLLDLRAMRLEMARLHAQRSLERMRAEVERCVTAAGVARGWWWTRRICNGH